MSINILVGKEQVEVEFIEWRPGEGLVFRVVNEPTLATQGVINPALYAALRGAPHAIYRTCCDSTPECAHVEGCSLAGAEDKK